MPQIINRSGVPIKRDQIVPARPIDVEGIEDTLASQQAQINNKANASTVGGLATAVSSKASQSSVDALAGTVAGKADASALAAKANASDLAAKANASDIPLPADIMPKAEATNPAKGMEQKKYALEDHQHPRVTSTTGNPATHIIAATGLATVTFT
jgi:hypothetical protein